MCCFERQTKYKVDGWSILRELHEDDRNETSERRKMSKDQRF